MSRWDDLAAAAGIEDHEMIVGAFSQKRFTPNGAYRFLWLLYTVYHWNEWRSQEHWLRRYRRAMWIQDVSRRARVRIPRHVSALERARAREDLSEYRRRVPASVRPEEFRRAERWSAR
jgi:hypothetical protein